MSYLDWLALIAMPDGETRCKYAKVLCLLDQIEFTWTMYSDRNRATDGEHLRGVYENETGMLCDKSGGASVLEVLIALAARCEEQLMYDPDEGDRTSVWFWEMFENLGLDSFEDEWFDEQEVREIVRRFLERDYYPDGYLGPFWISKYEKDLREIDLWYQMNYYMQEKFFKNS